MYRRLLTFLTLGAAGLSAQPRSASLRSESALPPIQFAAGEIHRALAARGTTLAEGALDGLTADANGTRFVLASGAAAARVAGQLGVAAPRSGTAQAYAIRVKQEPARRTYAVLAGDAAGAMYGGLDLAEAIRLDTLDALRDSDHAPHIAQRGIKFNIPLDVRTPSYSDSGDAAQQNIPEMWSFDFWRTFLDELARHRYNVLSLWSLHPFPIAGQSPGVSRRGARRCAADHSETRRHVLVQRHGYDAAGDAAQRGDGPAADDRGEDPLLARRDAVRARSRHRGLPVHVEHFHVRGRPASTASRRRRTIP